MEKSCSQCSLTLESAWSFCPRCGAETPLDTPAVTARESEKAPVRGAYGGLLLGLLVVPVLMIPGTLMCLTGLGAFLGVPMIVAAILAPLMGPLFGFGVLKGKCPWCGSTVTSFGSAKTLYCHACSQRIAITQSRFVQDRTA